MNLNGRYGNCPECKSQRTATAFCKYCDVARDRKSTRLNSSHSQISYAVFCLKKKTKSSTPTSRPNLPDRHGSSMLRTSRSEITALRSHSLASCTSAPSPTPSHASPALLLLVL